jgi:hypothetical protein
MDTLVVLLIIAFVGAVCFFAGRLTAPKKPTGTPDGFTVPDPNAKPGGHTEPWVYPGDPGYDPKLDPDGKGYPWKVPQ